MSCRDDLSPGRRAAPARQRGLVKGVLLFLAGLLVGANLLYFALTRQDATPPSAPPATSVSTPLPAVDAEGGASDAISDAPPVVPAVPAVPPTAASGNLPRAQPPQSLLIPVQGVLATQLQDTFSDARAQGRSHEAIDIMAPAGTPVLAVADGTVEKLFTSKAGGLTVYQFEPSGRYAYYYAHLQAYAPGLAEQQVLRRGDVLGYVGSTGNADPAGPHLHFAIFELGPERRWWQGTAINPYPLLRGH